MSTCKYISLITLSFLISCSQPDDRMLISLNGKDWTIVSAESGQGEKAEYFRNFPTSLNIPSSVPGNIYIDLMDAGILPDIYIGTNAKKTYPFAYKEWWYKKEFTLPDDWNEKRIMLNFSAIDYAAKIWLNGEFLGRHEGQFTPFTFDITSKTKIEETNKLIILIEAAPKNILDNLFTFPKGQVARQHAMDEVSNTLKFWKCRTISGWDWGTPLWTMGIWQDVTLVGSTDLYLDRLLIYPETRPPYSDALVRAKLNISSDIDNEVEFISQVQCLTSEAPQSLTSKIVNIKKGIQEAEFSLSVSSPLLWWPNNYGEQHLYRLTVTAKEKKSGRILDKIDSQFGIRDIKILRNPDCDSYKLMYWYSLASLADLPTRKYDPAVVIESGIREIPKDSLPEYLLSINGIPIFLHGGNWIPSDLLYGKPQRKEYEHLIRMAVMANYNVFRIWGGGLIEKQDFYNLCDQYGILVWQEMPQAGSHPLQTTEILTNTAQEQRQVLPLLINHPSIFRYGFGNEFYITANDNLHVLQFEDICKEMDPARMIIGSDPVCEFQRHGPHWFYIPQEYTTYNTGYPLTIGPDNPVEWTEYGASGASSVETLQKIIPEENLWPISATDSIWKWHNAFEAYTHHDWLENINYHKIFGKLNNLETEIKASQFVQAEGIRYANQANRRAKWHRSGCYMWTFNEPWPNAAHGCIVEYYGKPKPALYYTRNSYAPVNVSAEYSSINLSPDDTLNLNFFAVNARKENVHGNFSVKIIDLNGDSYFNSIKKTTIPALEACKIDSLDFIVPLKAINNVLLVRIELSDNGKIISSEIYTFGIKPSETKDELYLTPLLKAPKTEIGIDLKKTGTINWGNDQMICYLATVRNNSDIPALFVELKTGYNPDEVYIKDNYITLWPEEEKNIEIWVSPQVQKDLKTTDFMIKSWNDK